jgi:hypothetical protein
MSDEASFPIWHLSSLEGTPYPKETNRSPTRTTLVTRDTQTSQGHVLHAQRERDVGRKCLTNLQAMQRILWKLHSIRIRLSAGVLSVAQC